MPSLRERDRLRIASEELFADLWQAVPLGRLRQAFRPRADCFRTHEPPQLTVVLELAGVDPKDIRVFAGRRTLVVVGERARAVRAGRVFRQMEIECGPFERRLTLDEDVVAGTATATYHHGLLTVVLPVGSGAPGATAACIPVEARSP